MNPNFKSYQQPSNRTFFIKISMIVVSVVLFFVLIFVFAGSSQDIDQYPEEGSAVDYSKLARIINGEELVQKIGGLTQYEQLAQDLRFFALKRYPTYQEKEVIGFEITSPVEVQDNTLSFEGRYGSGDSDVKVDVTKLNNERIKSSILDSSGINLDSELPSASAYNQFLASLPVARENFTYSYLQGDITKDVLVTMQMFDRSLIDQALDEISTLSGDEFDSSRVKFEFLQQ